MSDGRDTPMGPAESCVGDATIAAFIHRELGAPDAARVVRHVAACDPCRHVLAELVRGQCLEDVVEAGRIAPEVLAYAGAGRVLQRLLAPHPYGASDYQPGDAIDDETDSMLDDMTDDDLDDTVDDRAGTAARPRPSVRVSARDGESAVRRADVPRTTGLLAALARSERGVYALVAGVAALMIIVGVAVALHFTPLPRDASAATVDVPPIIRVR